MAGFVRLGRMHRRSVGWTLDMSESGVAAEPFVGAVIAASFVCLLSSIRPLAQS